MTVFLLPVTLVLILILCICILIYAIEFKISNLKVRDLLLFTPFIITLFILLVGTLLEYEAGSRIPPDYILVFTAIMAFLHLPLSGYLFYYLQEVRPITIGLGLLQIWFSICVWYVCGMSVTGEWL